jgi:hypothetical protein
VFYTVSKEVRGALVRRKVCPVGESHSKGVTTYLVHNHWIETVIATSPMVKTYLTTDDTKMLTIVFRNERKYKVLEIDEEVLVEDGTAYSSPYIMRVEYIPAIDKLSVGFFTTGYDVEEIVQLSSHMLKGESLAKYLSVMVQISEYRSQFTKERQRELREAASE